MEDISKSQHISDFENDRERYRYETNRLGSFAGWPSSNPMFPTTLAKVGLYYTGHEDEVRCFVCGIRIKRWAETDLPLSKHERHSPRCQFILGCNVGNVPLVVEGEEFTLDKIREQEQNVIALRDSVPGQSSGGLSFNSITIQSLFNPNISTVNGQNKNLPQTGINVKNDLTPMQPNIGRFTVHFPVVTDTRLFCVPASTTSETQARNSSNFTSSSLSEALHDMSLTKSNNYPRSVTNCRTQVHALQTSSSPNVQIREIITGGIQSQADSACFYQDTSISFPATSGVPVELCNPARVREMTHHAAHSQYADIAIRFQSFRLWQSASIQPIARLCQAGFFYTGQDDRVRCFMCGGGLCNWEADDVPWQEHARWFNRCQYLDACRNIPDVQTAISSMQYSLRADSGSRTIVDEVRSGTEVGVPCGPVDEQGLEMGDPQTGTMDGDKKRDRRQKRKAKKQNGNNQLPEPIGGSTEKPAKNKENLGTISSENRALRDRVMCKVCLTNQVAIVFLPCSHLACCLDCAMQLQKCPICREHIKATVKVFIG